MQSLITDMAKELERFNKGTAKLVVYLDLALIFLRFLFSLRILFLRHLALILNHNREQTYKLRYFLPHLGNAAAGTTPSLADAWKKSPQEASQERYNA